MSSEISEKAKTSALAAMNQWFIGEAADYFKDNKGVGVEKAKQLALAGVIAANTAMENAKDNITWQNVDFKKFGAELFRLIGYGIDFGNKEAYVIPYRNPKTGKFDLTTPISADGLVKLAKLYSVKPIKDFKKFIVRQGDIVDVEYGEKTSWHYKPVMFNSAPVLGYLTVVEYEDGTTSPMITTLEEIEQRRKASKVPNSPAWTNWYDGMALAKSTRKHMKSVSINLPAEFDEDYEPITKDMGDISSPKIALSYPEARELAMTNETTEEAVKGDAYEPEQVSFEGTPFPIQ